MLSNPTCNHTPNQEHVWSPIQLLSVFLPHSNRNHSKPSISFSGQLVVSIEHLPLLLTPPLLYYISCSQSQHSHLVAFQCNGYLPKQKLNHYCCQCTSVLSLDNTGCKIVPTLTLTTANKVRSKWRIINLKSLFKLESEGRKVQIVFFCRITKDITLVNHDMHSHHCQPSGKIKSQPVSKRTVP